MLIHETPRFHFDRPPIPPPPFTPVPSPVFRVHTTQALMVVKAGVSPYGRFTGNVSPPRESLSGTAAMYE